ncbi:MAG: DNA-processing protein DprA [Elusimicrobia bacterium]|nr:DNA-processing protein DprA [Elusimicrobiota bacterium]
MELETYAIIRLSLCQNIGVTRFNNLIEAFGSAENVFSADVSDLTQVEGINPLIAQNILNESSKKFADCEIALAARENARILTFKDAAYPEQLRNIQDKPPIIYVKGKLLDSDFPSISVVGSRRTTVYGKSVASEFSNYFAKSGITIVSGLARGIDTCAHMSALNNNSRTIAILGNGLLNYYPPENKKLQDEIAEKGALISEFPLNSFSDRQTFPRRNRIIAALSVATLVVEAGLASGAMITARICADYGRDVFAVPGSIYSKYSQGTNDLIKNGAFVALTPQDVLSQIKEFAHLASPQTQLKLEENVNFTPEELKIYALLKNAPEGLSPDEISLKTKIPISKISIILVNLEIALAVRSVPGQKYTIIR